MVTPGLVRSSLIAHSLVGSFAYRSFAHLLIVHLLIGSFRSNQISDCEQFAQIAHDKWVTVSKSLRLLRGNEGWWAICSGRSEEMSDVSESLILLTKNEQISDSQKNFG